MITKGVIKTINYSNNTCTVRIPLFETAGSSGEVIFTATFMIQPGIYNGYSEGDVVFVDFEDNKLSYPIIIGKLFKGATTELANKKLSSITASSLQVSKDATIPLTTKLSFSNPETTRVKVDRDYSNYKTLLDIIKAIKDTGDSIENLTKDVSGQISEIKTYYLEQADSEDLPDPIAEDSRWSVTKPSFRDGFEIWQKTVCYNNRGQVLSTEIICLTEVSSVVSYWLNINASTFTGKTQATAITIKALAKVGSMVETTDETSILKVFKATDSTTVIATSTNGNLRLKKETLQNYSEDLLVVAYHKTDIIEKEYYSTTIKYMPLNTPILTLTNYSGSLDYDSYGFNKLNLTSTISSTAEVKLNNEELPNVHYSWNLDGCEKEDGSSTINKTIIIKSINEDYDYATATCTATYEQAGHNYSLTAEFRIIKNRAGVNYYEIDIDNPFASIAALSDGTVNSETLSNLTKHTISCSYQTTALQVEIRENLPATPDLTKYYLIYEPKNINIFRNENTFEVNSFDSNEIVEGTINYILYKGSTKVAAETFRVQKLIQGESAVNYYFTLDNKSTIFVENRDASATTTVTGTCYTIIGAETTPYNGADCKLSYKIDGKSATSFDGTIASNGTFNLGELTFKELEVILTVGDNKWDSKTIDVSYIPKDGTNAESPYTITILNDRAAVLSSTETITDYDWKTNTQHWIKVLYGADPVDPVVENTSRISFHQGSYKTEYGNDLVVTYEATNIETVTKEASTDTETPFWIENLTPTGTTAGSVLYTLYYKGKSVDSAKFEFSIIKIGTDGRSITGVKNYYLATASDTIVPSITDLGWKEKISDLTNKYGIDYPYLWNYEEISYNEGTPDTTEAEIISYWAKDGSAATSYWLQCSSPIHTGKNQTTPIAVTAMKKVGEGTETSDNTATLKYQYEGDSIWTTATGASFTLNALENKNLIIKAYHSGVEYEAETITYSPLNTPTLDLSNDSAAITYEGVTKTSDNVSSTATLYLNGEAISAEFLWHLENCNSTTTEKITWSESTGGTKQIINNPTITISALTANSANATCWAFEKLHSIELVVYRNNFTDDTWNLHGTFGDTESWTNAPKVDPGKYFVILGKSTDTNTAHVLWFESIESSSYQYAYGKCIAHKTFYEKDFTLTKQLKGDTGTAGKGIEEIIEYYQTTSTATEPDIPEAANILNSESWAADGWSTSVTQPTSLNPYLWNVEVIKYTDNDTNQPKPVIIGTHGETFGLNILPSAYSVVGKETNGSWSYSPTSITVEFKEVRGSSVIDCADSDRTYKYEIYKNNETEAYETETLSSTHKTATITLPNTEVSSYSIKLLLDYNGSTSIVDSETISVVHDGKDGQKGADAVYYWIKGVEAVHTGANQTDTISVTAMKRVGNDPEQVDSGTTGAVIWYNNNGTWKSRIGGSNEANCHTLNFNKGEFYNDFDLKLILTHDKKWTPPSDVTATNSKVEDWEVITYSPLNSPILSLTNDSASLVYTANNSKKTESDTVSSTAELYLNGSKITAGVTYSWSLSNCTDSNGATTSNAATITIKDLLQNSATATCEATYKSQTYTKIFTITKQFQGDTGENGSSIEAQHAFYWVDNYLATPNIPENPAKDWYWLFFKTKETWAILDNNNYPTKEKMDNIDTTWCLVFYSSRTETTNSNGTVSYSAWTLPTPYLIKDEDAYRILTTAEGLFGYGQGVYYTPTANNIVNKPNSTTEYYKIGDQIPEAEAVTWVAKDPTNRKDDIKLYINANYIKTGALKVEKDTGGDGVKETLFEAGLDNNTVKIGGFEVNGTNLYSTPSPATLAKITKIYRVCPDSEAGNYAETVQPNSTSINIPDGSEDSIIALYAPNSQIPDTLLNLSQELESLLAKSYWMMSVTNYDYHEDAAGQILVYDSKVEETFEGDSSWYDKWISYEYDSLSAAWSVHPDAYFLTNTIIPSRSVYIGTDRIQLGEKFIVDNLGNVTATGLRADKITVKDSNSEILLSANDEEVGTTNKVQIGGFEVDKDKLEAVSTETTAMPIPYINSDKDPQDISVPYYRLSAGIDRQWNSITNYNIKYWQYMYNETTTSDSIKIHIETDDGNSSGDFKYIDKVSYNNTLYDHWGGRLSSVGSTIPGIMVEFLTESIVESYSTVNPKVKLSTEELFLGTSAPDLNINVPEYLYSGSAVDTLYFFPHTLFNAATYEGIKSIIYTSEGKLKVVLEYKYNTIIVPITSETKFNFANKYTIDGFTNKLTAGSDINTDIYMPGLDNANSNITTKALRAAELANPPSNNDTTSGDTNNNETETTLVTTTIMEVAYILKSFSIEDKKIYWESNNGEVISSDYYLYNNDTGKTNRAAIYEVHYKESYFQVFPEGAVNANRVSISGEISAQTGKIGGFTIEGNSLSSSAVNLSPQSLTLTGASLRIDDADQNNGISIETIGSTPVIEVLGKAKLQNKEGNCGFEWSNGEVNKTYTFRPILSATGTDGWGGTNTATIKLQELTKDASGNEVWTDATNLLKARSFTIYTKGYDYGDKVRSQTITLNPGESTATISFGGYWTFYGVAWSSSATEFIKGAGKSVTGSTFSQGINSGQTLYSLGSIMPKGTTQLQSITIYYSTGYGAPIHNYDYIGTIEAYINGVGDKTTLDAWQTNSSQAPTWVYTKADNDTKTAIAGAGYLTTPTYYNYTDTESVSIFFDGTNSAGSNQGQIVTRTVTGTAANLGDSNHKWDNIYGKVVYSDSGECTTSDIRAKSNISNDISKYDKLFDSLKPTYYSINTLNDNKTHLGFIAQDIEQSLLENNLSRKDFGGLVINGEGYDKETDIITDYDETSYGIAYVELHALEVRQIQLLKAQVAALEAQVKALEEKLKN